MIREKYLITEDYRKASIELLIDNLAALRARLNITKEELANVIGVSRQTFYSIETGKREMSWPIYMAIIFFFRIFIIFKIHFNFNYVFKLLIRK